MRYCLNLPIGGECADPRTLGDFAAIAEDSGWDGLFLEDYIIYQNRQELPVFDTWIALAVMALRTRRIRLGTMVTPLARRRPWKLARETVTVDHLSGGRLILGVGVAHSNDMSFTRFGEEPEIKRRAEMTDEALAILDGLWRGEPFSYHGEHFRVEEVTCLPRPLQQPRIPVWIGGGYPSRGPLRRAARWDGACLYRAVAPGNAENSGAVLTPEEIAALKCTIERERTASTPFDIMVGGGRREADPGQERQRLRASAAAGATWAQQWTPPADLETMRAYIAAGPVRIE